MVQHVQGYGGIRFAGNGIVAEFDSGYSTIKADPVYYRKENVSHKIVQRLLGFRITIEVNLFNITESSYIQLQNLFTMLNGTIDKTQQKVIALYPRYSIANQENYFYNVLIDSDATLKDIARVKVGQTLKMKFVEPDLKPIPTTTGNVDISYFIDSSNNKIVDESGNNIILKNN